MFLDNDRCSERHIFVRTISTLSMNDREFLRAFHACKLSSEDFRHRGHLRLAWLVLRDHGLEESVRLLSVGIRQFASFKGAIDIYNETLTQFWTRIVNPCNSRTSFRSRIRTVHQCSSHSARQTAPILSLATRDI